MSNQTLTSIHFSNSKLAIVGKKTPDCRARLSRGPPRTHSTSAHRPAKPRRRVWDDTAHASSHRGSLHGRPGGPTRSIVHARGGADRRWPPETRRAPSPPRPGAV